MVLTDFSGNYINTENTPNNTLVTIVSAGKYVEKGTTTKFEAFVIDVDNGEKTLEFTIRQQTGRRCQEAWGKDSIAWLGKKLTLKVEKAVNGKDVIEGYPLVEQKA